MKITSDDLDIEFTVPFDSDTTPNESEIKMYNLTDDTIHRFKNNKNLVVNAGYKGDVGVILSGYISKVKTVRADVDKITTIHVLDSQPLDVEKTLTKTYKKNIKASQIVDDLLSRLKLDAYVDLYWDHTYAKGYTVDGEIVEELAGLAKECGVTFFVSKGKAYVSGVHSGQKNRFTLNEEGGLIGTPAPFEDGKLTGFSVTSLLQYRLATSSAIRMESRQGSGKFYVYQGKHKWSGDEFVTELDLIY
ncbi:hypothetical protein JOD44_001761 [Salimicrobium jeotgali]|nr:hypothetical protein [Salimicrobium jeotgali]MBM7696644.1 hypothetical protein [Salimicrobium jeotgali]